MGTFLLYETKANFKTFQSQNQTIDVQESSATQELGISMLEPHTQYSFLLRAINDIGSSDPVTVLRWTLPTGEFETIYTIDVCVIVQVFLIKLSLGNLTMRSMLLPQILIEHLSDTSFITLV